MFSSSRTKNLTCGFKVNTNSPEWHKSMTKILKKIRGGNFWIDVDEGMAYVTGQGDPNKLLKLMGSKRGKDAEMAFVKTGTHHHRPHHDPNFCNNYPSSFFGGQSATPYWPGYYPQGQGMVPFQQYPFGYSNYGYY
ncbi:PREDICTED: uncharacterized protein LOC104780933 [Camelina sativa]|uniref:Uncharacterized protein LOC104780933 n=1 Tax=Camelina sativa TaxID=90675 RepID=A0ABM0YNW8_CAMSA|nr:PREDICTED: uncharacterized protein LOC104780933 [Camelina sativa]